MTPASTHSSLTRVADLRAHFHLHATPFTREIPLGLRLPLPMYEQAEAALRSAVEDRASAALIAPAGTGKSVVLRTVAASLPEARYRVCYLHVTSLSKRDMCRYLATAIGARPAGHTAALVAAIQERVSALMAQEALRTVLIIDEAHDMRPDVLGLVRLLTNFEIDSRLVLSIVLAGQTGLRALLRRDDLEDVRGRLAQVATLRLLSRDETHAYIRHRATIAGAATDLFDDAASDALFEVGGGNLRATDTLALRTLYEAAADGAAVAGAEHVVRARARVTP